MGRYVFSKQAERDLVDIYRYSYANYGERQADAYAESLKQKCQFLAENPLLQVERN